MNKQVLEYPGVGEKMHVYSHPSGLKAFVIPKKGYLKKYATFATHYGSIDNEFVSPGEDAPTKVPDGIAHFLEHKLFEQKEGSVMDRFSELGASPNAYTGFNQTVYLFSCTDRFEENLRLLLEFVQNPYITAESVEKEKGIIGQEISMYQDDPGWRAYFNLLGGLYGSHPVRKDIAGSHESIARIDRDTLYKCYNTFYHPSNMVVCVVGDVEAEPVFEQVERSLKLVESRGEIKRLFPEESEKANKSYAEQALAVSMPMFQMGFKDSRHVLKGFEALKHETAMKIILDMLLGRSSGLYNELYGEGLINTSFEFDYTIESTYAFSVFGGESGDPLKVRDRFLREVSRLQAAGLERESFERIKKAHYGRFFKQLNSVERISHSFISTYFREINLFDYSEVYDKITYEYAAEAFSGHFDPDKLALSVIKPI